MTDKLILIAFFSAVIALIYLLSMQTTPRHGVMRVIEHTATGAAICFACWLALTPFGISVPQGLMPALCAGYLGLPGAALSVFLSLWP